MFWLLDLDDGETGYISIMAVRKKKSSKNDESYDEALKKIIHQTSSKFSMDQKRSRAATMGVRGLLTSKDTQDVSFSPPNYEAVDRVEKKEQTAVSELERWAVLIEKEVEQRMNEQIFK